MSRLEALGVTKRFRLREVVKDLSLSIESGQVVGLLGPNGAGKTTAFYMIVGLIRCDRGTIQLNGRDEAIAGQEKVVEVSHGLQKYEARAMLHGLLKFG